MVDLDVLLQPISDENPSGESLRYSGIYDEITEARRADDTLNRGDWQEELKVADYRRVIDLAVPALSNRIQRPPGRRLALGIARKRIRFSLGFATVSG